MPIEEWGLFYIFRTLLVEELPQHPETTMVASNCESCDVVNITARATCWFNCVCSHTWLVIGYYDWFSPNVYAAFLNTEILNNFINGVIVFKAIYLLFLKILFWIVFSISLDILFVHEGMLLQPIVLSTLDQVIIHLKGGLPNILGHFITRLRNLVNKFLLFSFFLLNLCLSLLHFSNVS